MRERGPKRVSAFFVPSLMVNSAAGHVAMAFDLQGPSLGVNDGCASASAAIGTGLRLIRHSAVDVILCGGAEASLTDAVLHGLRSEGIADATGLPSTEAAGILILESLSSAQQRHATILAELRGYGQSSSAGDLSPDATAMASVRSLTAALNDACLRWCDIDWVIVNLPAPMPPDNPVWRAMTSMFQSDGDVPVMDELTVPFGRLFGATGAVFSAIGVEAIDRRMLPSRRLHEDRAGLRRPDSANANAATANVKNVLVHNVSITGSCASLLYSRFDED